MKKDKIGDPLSRIDGRLKVTGGAKYSGEYKLPGLTYGVLVSATIPCGTVSSMDIQAAGKAPGVLAVITPFNAPKVPGYQPGAARPVRGLKLFNDDKVYFNGQPIALVVAETFERATYAASLVKATYKAEPFETDFHKNFDKGVIPNEGRYKDYVRGEADAYKKAPVVVEQDYMLPSEMHNPMELHVTTAFWDGDDKVTLYTKSQGVIGSQRSIANAFGLEVANVQINSRFVGGAFGSSLRTWPHEVAAVQAARLVKRPVKLTLTREQMFTLVGYRPLTIQRIGLGATTDGKLMGITHESHSQTAVYEEFTENAVNVSRFLYASPNANTRYKVVPLNVGVPTPMRGPGEATGSFALESALDELSYKLNIDPIELRLKNYTDMDPERNLPWSSKFLKECYQLGAERIGWEKRPTKPGMQRDGDWMVGYGLGCGAFGAYRSKTQVRIKLTPDGSVNIQTATSDIGPGTGTAMTLIAADILGIPAERISFELGNSAFPVAPTQGGSQTVSSVGSAVHDVCIALKQKLNTLAGLPADNTAEIEYATILQRLNLPSLELTQESQSGEEARKYSMYSFSAHFAQVHVHSLTGIVRVKRLVAVVDGGKIVNHKTASSQMIGGAVGGIGMALTEEAIFDDRFGRYVNGNLADYHVPVNADAPDIEAIFIDKPDPIINPIGTKGLGEISLIGVAAAVANAVFNATGKRIRDLPITPDKVLMT
ncbi:MAG: xanthine dehydrogenase family protein molybdopterin-binding subunit [Bacteroidota bacterium]|nr:xanthine dehydrogenase family protein molybdopterin-binding subunit [Bacteroidota bacterium]MDP4215387.1 xanthine dehydrogenase family protein molybdopterin-binding subunit [Bacteroidota bacterium]MDP4244531.1 xanthine dehydrogenase family protein molybdopterin-binding subunit [Bacteroidota bacterium]MDP4256060.1 xanthine dehydrogenase family protein molybdopterin-binding subunit [Bacteroidota bacterium]MDP4259947.1 xanthine dehydrogenase family protein molybdopterin-binding subunit [Bactero